MTLASTKTTLETQLTSLWVPEVVPNFQWDWYAQSPNPTDRYVGRVNLVSLNYQGQLVESNWSVAVATWTEQLETTNTMVFDLIGETTAAYKPNQQVCTVNGDLVSLSSIQVGLPNSTASTSHLASFEGIWQVVLFEFTVLSRSRS